MHWRIRTQLLAPLLTLLLGVVGVSAWTAVASARRAWGQTEERFRGVAQTFAEYPIPLKDTVLKQVKRLSGADLVLLTPTGERVATTIESADLELPPPGAVVADWRDLRMGARVRVEGTAYFCSGLRVHSPTEGSTVYIFYPEALWRDALWAAIEPSLVLGGFVGVTSVLLAIGVGQRVSRRIGELERRTRMIAGGDFSPMPLPTGRDEIRDLAHSVNEMAQQLAQYQETVRKTERLRLLGQVSGGLAHQLRNGIAGVRLAVQLHTRECAGRGDVEPLEVALRQLTLLEQHLKRFLDLGRAGKLRKEQCSLQGLIGEVVGLLTPQCRHGRIDLRWQPLPEEVTLTGDAGQLGQLFLNVISNGVEAAGPGGWVEIRLAPEPGKAVVTVTDSGPGPPAEVAARLFEPFVTGKPEGVGLGLAVARQVAEAHGGSLTWARPDSQTCFRIELPLEQGK
jgi:signal transduction histidine kinase